MSGFPLLDLAIGMVYVYLLLSLVCSSLNEGLESILRNRANDLEAGIRTLLGDNKGSWWASFLPWVNSIKNSSITREFYTHPLIRSLFQSEKKLPSYVPSRSFALAVLELAGQSRELIQGATSDGKQTIPNTVAWADSVNGTAIPDRLKDSLKSLVAAAAGDAQQARINVENWFNSSMDRVSGWYKSRTQKILFCIGLATTVFLNADSIAIYSRLSQSKNLQAIVNAAGTAASLGVNSQSNAGQQSPNAPASTTQQSPASQTSAGQQNPNALTSIQQQIGNALNQLGALDVGIGWVRESDQKGTLDRSRLAPSWHSGACSTEKRPCEQPVYWSMYLLYLHGIGWLMTAAAISLGAPFWFDTLNRFIVVRSTVKPKEKSQEEGSKDAAK